MNKIMLGNFLKYSIYFMIVIVFGVGGLYLFFEKIGLNKTVEVPALAGINITEATDLLNKRKLSLNIKSRVHDEHVPEGFIVEQLNEPGGKLKAGSEVNVIVSSGRGGEIFAMPSFEGQHIDEIKMTLKNLDIKLGKVTWVHSDSADKGVVIAQRPLPGVTRGNEINFLVSSGPYDVFYKCPSFINMTIYEARVVAEKLGIKMIELEEGIKVVSQRPEAGAIIRKGDSVEVTLRRNKAWF